MPGSWWYKFVTVIAIFVLSVGVLIPTFFAPPKDTPPEEWPAWYRWYSENVFGERLTLGLDLQGGLHLQYQVDVDKAIAHKLETFARDIRERLQDDGHNVRIDVLEDGTSMLVDYRNREGEAALRDIITLYPLEWHEETGSRARLEVDSDYIDETRSWAIDTAISTIRDRVDGLGVAEPSISRRGDSDIIVQLPGLGAEDFEQAKELIGTTARLEFHGIHDQNSTYWRNVAGLIPEQGTLEYFQNAVEARVLEELRAFGDMLQNLPASDPAATPLDSLIGFEEQISYHPQTGQVLDDQTRYRMILLKARVEMTGETISDVRPAADPTTNRPFVSITFDAEGKDLFCRVTTEYEQRLLAIVLDDIVKSAPIIEEPICQGRARINMGSTGRYDAIYREVESLVIVLRHGALPAPIEPQFETQVGPSLGDESVRAGTLAMVVGSILVIIFMAIYYRASGLIANFALVGNIFLVLAMLTGIGATMTLPGIAGIILTVGMAVDANVIIFERIREELRLGKTARDAVAAGYAKALWTILDANITTAIAALVLANYGSGPIKGFAITLLLGIIASVFTALVVTRLIFDLYLAKSRTQRLSI
jgi:preprotein translocase subunit SecD